MGDEISLYSLADITKACRDAKPPNINIDITQVQGLVEIKRADDRTNVYKIYPKTNAYEGDYGREPAESARYRLNDDKAITIADLKELQEAIKIIMGKLSPTRSNAQFWQAMDRVLKLVS